jgi:hypothetical protein
MRFVADVNIIGGGRPDFPVAVTGTSVSMVIVRRGAKKFFVVMVDVVKAAPKCRLPPR